MSPQGELWIKVHLINVCETFKSLKAETKQWSQVSFSFVFYSFLVLDKNIISLFLGIYEVKRHLILINGYTTKKCWFFGARALVLCCTPEKFVVNN